MYVVNFFFGIFIVALGALGVKYNGPITHLFGQNNWFERKLGQGATFMVFQALALFVIIFGFLTMFSFHDDFLDLVTQPLQDLFNPGGNKSDTGA